MEKILKAEMWDKMQYLFRNYYDRMVHCVQYYDAPINVKALKEVLLWMTEKAPILHSSFHGNVVEPYWKIEDYRVNDFFSEKLNCEKGGLENDTYAFLCQSVPVDSNVQYRFGVFSDGEKWAIAMIVNHMCMDGGDFKYFMRKLAENYNKLIKGEKDFDIKTGSRSYDAVYSKLNDEETQIAKSLYKNISAVKDEHYFPLTPDDKNDKTMICRRVIGADIFKRFRTIGKTMDVTVNDLMLAFYVRSLYEIGMYNSEERLSIPCMVDLRRHIEEGGANTGLTNHTGFMVCSTERKGETVNDTLIEVLRSVRKSKNDPYMGLYSLPLLKLAYTVFPYVISETAIKIGYLNPLIGMSNIGVLDDEALQMGDAKLTYAWMTGAVKYKPYMQLALTSVSGRMTMTVAVRGNGRDKEIIERFFDIIENNIKDFIELNKHRLEKPSESEVQN